MISNKIRKKRKIKRIDSSEESGQEQSSNVDDLPDDQVVNCLNNVLNLESWQEAISILNHYLCTKKIKFYLFEMVAELLQNVHKSIVSNYFQNPNHIISIIDLFYNMSYDDMEMVHHLIDHNIHEIFYPFIQQAPTLKLFRELLFFDKAPKDLNDKAITIPDHDERQIEYEKICIKKKWNSVAHFCDKEQIATKLLEILSTERKNKVLRLIDVFGDYYFTFEGFIPVFDPILQIIYQDQDINTRIYAINSISSFAGSSKRSLQFFLGIPNFQKLFIDYPIESQDVLVSILYCARNVMSICEYLEDKICVIFLDFAAQYLNSKDLELLSVSVKIISKGTLKGESYILYCMNKGIIQHLFQIFVEQSLSFEVQSLIFIAICKFFAYADLECSKKIAELGFFNIISDYFEPIASRNIYAMESAIDALFKGLEFSSVNPELSEWKYLIIDDDQIIDPIRKFCDEFDMYQEESVEYYAYSFLQRIDSEED